jgi:hypothetical protein
MSYNVTVTCDRCGYDVDGEVDVRPAKWTQLVAFSDIVDEDGARFELCPDCTVAFQRLLDGGTVE